MKDETYIESLLKESRLFPPPKDFSNKAYIKNVSQYDEIYRKSIEEPDKFWAEQAEAFIDWDKKWDRVLDYDFNNPYVKWFLGGKLNASYNCLDRHQKTWRRNKAAIIWEGDHSEATRTLTYQELYREVNRFANVLKKKGVKKGDTVTIYLSMIPELPIAMLACARIGAIHSVVFGGFSAQALRERVKGCKSKVIITANEGRRGGRAIPLKANTDEALEGLDFVENVIVVKRVQEETNLKQNRDSWWHEEMSADDITRFCQPESVDAEDPLFILYTSGSTGAPKGVLHTTGGYLVYTSLTFKWIFDYKEEDIYFCTADIGWVTGHSYIIYGPLSIGATSLMFEGIPTYPKPDRFWEIVDKYEVNTFYTAPTAIRALMREGEKWVDQHDLSSLRLLGTVGEPINPEAWMWYYKVVGRENCPIVDTWWQTETGGILITPLPGAMTLKPGSANKPFPGIVPEVLREDGSRAGVNEGGYLVINKPWPGIIRGTYGDSENKKVKEVYFSRFPGKYFTGDGAKIDQDGDFWLMGRIDDVLNVSGHRLGTADIESALVSHPGVAEAAVVGYPHNIKGTGIHAFIVLKENRKADDELHKELIKHVADEIGPIAKPDRIQFTTALPKTRSGKIMRRILRKIAEGDVEYLGDVTTLADPSVIEELLRTTSKTKPIIGT